MALACGDLWKAFSHASRNVETGCRNRVRGFGLVTPDGPGYRAVVSYFDPVHMRPFGKHMLRVDGDSIFMISRGVLTLDEFHELHVIYRNVRREHGALFVLYDGRENTGIEPEVRRVASSEQNPDMRPDLQVLFGAPFVVRVLLDLLFKAQRLLKKDVIAFYTVDTEAQALAFFDSERNRIRRELLLVKPQ